MFVRGVCSRAAARGLALPLYGLPDGGGRKDFEMSATLPAAREQLMPLPCRLGWHAWSVWGKPFEAKAVFGTLTKQNCECVKCGARRQRYVNTERL